MDDSNRSLDILQRVTADEVSKGTVEVAATVLCLLEGAAAERDLDQKDLLLSVAIGRSDAALSSRFLIDRLTAASIRHAFEAKYAKLFKRLDTYRRDA